MSETTAQMSRLKRRKKEWRQRIQGRIAERIKVDRDDAAAYVLRLATSYPPHAQSFINLLDPDMRERLARLLISRGAAVPPQRAALTDGQQGQP